MARERKSIPLKKPFDDGKGGKVTAIILQEPSAPDFFELGAPQTWVRSRDGMALIDNDAAIKAYVERMIVEPDPLLAMTQMGVVNAIVVKEAVLDFFRESPATP
jgi:hypothetical protein